MLHAKYSMWNIRRGAAGRQGWVTGDGRYSSLVGAFPMPCRIDERPSRCDSRRPLDQLPPRGRRRRRPRYSAIADTGLCGDVREAHQRARLEDYAWTLRSGSVGCDIYRSIPDISSCVARELTGVSKRTGRPATGRAGPASRVRHPPGRSPRHERAGSSRPTRPSSVHPRHSSAS
jgi:hypothetical protein